MEPSTIENSAFKSAIDTLFEFDRKEQALDRMVHLAILGIRQVEYHPKLLEAAYGESRRNEDLDLLFNANLMAKAAADEMTHDFPLLHAQAVTTLWGDLEAAIRNVFATLIQVAPQARACPEFGKIKVRLSDYEALEGFERSLFLIDSLEESIGTRRRNGIGRFEAIFEVFGMKSQVSSEVIRCLLELYHLRNVIVHRHGKVDKRLLTDCPSANLREGEDLKVSHGQYHQYRVAISLYLFEMVNRIRGFFGLPPIEHKTDCACAAHSFSFKPHLQTTWRNHGCSC